MKYTKSEKVLVALLAVLASLAGFLLAGCDGGQGEGTEVVIPAGEPAGLRCQVPSPTYERTSMPQNGVPVLSVVVSNAPEAVSICQEWTVVVPAGVNGAGQPYPASCKMPGSAECSVTMTDAVCRNAADDFVDSAGGRHCFHLAAKLDGHGKDVCAFAAQDPGVRAGTSTCELGALGLFDETKVDSRTVELCTPDGRFVGWQCPGDATM